MPPILLTLLLLAQLVALGVLLRRLARGRTRRPPVPPASAAAGSVSVVVATLNEARRIGPCLAGLRRQGPEMLEAIVVDSASTDGTRELVLAAAAADPRIRLVDDGPLPPGWVGKVWALECGLRQARGPWVLGVDADTEPQPGMVGGVVAAAESLGYDAVSFGPKFARDQFVRPGHAYRVGDTRQGLEMCGID